MSRNATKNILSGGKLYKAGFLAVIKPDAPSLLWHERTATEIPLHLKGNTFYLQLAKEAEHSSAGRARIVAPVAQESLRDQWENAGGDDPIEEASIEGEDLPDLRGEGFGAPVHFDASSTVREIKERLKELGWSSWGNKAGPSSSVATCYIAIAEVLG